MPLSLPVLDFYNTQEVEELLARALTPLVTRDGLAATIAPVRADVVAAVRTAADALAAAVSSLRNDLATKKAVTDAVALLATKAALTPLAVKTEVDATYVTKQGIVSRLEPYALKTELTPLATDIDLANAIRLLVARTELPALATDAEVLTAVAGLVTRTELEAEQANVAALELRVAALETAAPPA